MITLAAVDGTSTESGTAANPGAYQRTFKDSFCNQLYRKQWAPFTNPYYLRGPYLSGRTTGARAIKAHAHVKTQWASGNAKAIFLAGFSRGGAAVIEVARKLKYEESTPIPVECLILFDPVDRTNTVGGIFSNTPIPDNVKTVIYAKRSPAARSRQTFGNCGLSKENPGMDYRLQPFFATHGGIGGTPWKHSNDPVFGVAPLPTIWEPGEPNPSFVTVNQEKRGSQQVKGWVLPQVATAFVVCMARLAMASAPPATGPTNVTPTARPGNGNVLATHKVVTGDSLSKIAIQYYGRDKMMKYKKIHQHNIRVIGPNENLILPGQVLEIPKL